MLPRKSTIRCVVYITNKKVIFMKSSKYIDNICTLSGNIHKEKSFTPGTELRTIDVVKWFIRDDLKVKWQSYRAFWTVKVNTWNGHVLLQKLALRIKLSTLMLFWNDKWYDKYHEITDQIISQTQWWPVRTLHWLQETTK
jgi:hypothetical protein